MLTEKTVDYAEFTMAKNTAHTAIQMAMQEINKDDTWMTTYDKDNPWTGSIEGRNFELYIDALNDVSANNYWDDDSLRIVSRATQPIFGGTDSLQAEVVTVFLKGRFSGLVPDFGGALQFPTGFGSITADGNAHSIDGTADHCEDKPAIVTSDQETKDDLDNNENLNMDGEVAVDSTLNYEPTDELIERLKNSGNAITVDSDYSGTLGTEEEPGIFFIDGDVKLTGQQSQGYGIMVIQDNAYMSYDSAGTSLTIRGNFEFNGLVIFENAQLFDGRGTPTINGSVLVGQTSDNENPIDIELGGNIEINYDCDGEDFAKMAAANAVSQNRYTKVVSSEGTNFVSN
ncbi:MAG: hypothetical protein WD016_12255 [Balneolaceae bacterium]